MSRPEQSPPPAGERIHLPGPSVQPVLLALGLMMTLLGLLGLWFLTVLGVLLLLFVTIGWIRSASREYQDLPAHRD